MRLEDLEPTSTQRPLVRIAARLLGFARSVVESGGDFLPVLHAETPRGDAMVSLHEIIAPGTEDIRGQAIARILQDLGAASYVIALESWTLLDDFVHEQSRPVSEDDRRISSLTLHGETLAGDALMAAYRIVEGDERRVDVNEPLWLELAGAGEMQDGQAAGMLVGLLRPVMH